MKLFREYVEYLQDNPEGYWFKRKLYGFGWTPAKKEGWYLTFAFLAAIIAGAIYIEKNPSLMAENPTRVLVLFGLIVFLFLVITWKTGEPLKWQWGKGSMKR